MFTQLKRHVRLAAVLLTVISSSAHAVLIPTGIGSTMLNVDVSGELLDARNVLVSGDLYDVVFVDGAPLDLFPSALDATTETQATQFAQALLDQVFLDVAGSFFDSNPSSIAGCESQGFSLFDNCFVHTPYEITATFIRGMTAANYNAGNPNSDSVSPLFGGVGFDTAGNVNNVFADFSLSNAVPPSNDIPAPATAFLILAGLGILGARKIKVNIHA